jgi:hypothetical protein
VGLGGNLVVRVGHNPNIPINIPSIAMAFSLSRPNEKTAAETVKLASFIRDTRDSPGSITADKGNFAPLRPETLHAPMRQLGFKPVADYLDTELGVKRGKAGAIQVEGLNLCPSTPKHRIDTETYRLRIGERTRFALHDKELPDANSHVPKVALLTAQAPPSNALSVPSTRKRQRSESRTFSSGTSSRSSRSSASRPPSVSMGRRTSSMSRHSSTARRNG